MHALDPWTVRTLSAAAPTAGGSSSSASQTLDPGVYEIRATASVWVGLGGSAQPGSLLVTPAAPARVVVMEETTVQAMGVDAVAVVVVARVVEVG